MDVSHLRNYGVAFSDAEATWPAELKAEMRRKAKNVVLGHLSGWQKLQFGFLFLSEQHRCKSVDLSAIRARGMHNEAFLAQQVQYIAVFSSVARLVGTSRAVTILQEVMDVTAREALLLCLPEPELLRETGDPLAAFAAYSRGVPAVSSAAGCHEVVIAEDTDDAFEMRMTWCVWLELARALDVPDACLPNCYSDQLVFPDFMSALGIDYTRTQTLASGGTCCNFRFARQRA
jgi:L-2-amino-thiazoline-4-carboxylic acid hydrolase